MRFFLVIALLSFFALNDCYGQKSKRKKHKLIRPKILVYGDSLRTDSIVVYETEIGYILPDYSSRFKGVWNIQVMKKQSMAKPDSLTGSYIEFNEDSLFTAFIGCNKLSGKYIIKGPTIKFTLLNNSLAACPDDLEQWFIKLIGERVSYFGVDEKILYLKDVAYNIVFYCARKEQEVIVR